MLKGIDNVGVAVTDLARSIAFYEKLGFHTGDEYEAEVKGCTMTSETAVLFLFQTQRTDPQAVQREASLAHNPPGLDHISFLVEDVNQSYIECQAKGISFLGEPQDQDWGARIVAFKDPDGNNLYFLQYL
jgi:catechol 2,3-dioxygenase-like lactoylglutathione lyase family enzyme